MAKYAGNQIPHVKNWSNTTEVPDAFRKKFYEDQIPHVKNWSNPEEVRDAFVKKFAGSVVPEGKNKSDLHDSAVNLLEISKAAASASATGAEKPAVRRAGIQHNMFLASKKEAGTDSHAWLFLAAALPAAGLIVFLSARRFAPPVEDDMTGYYLQA